MEDLFTARQVSEAEIDGLNEQYGAPFSFQWHFENFGDDREGPYITSTVTLKIPGRVLPVQGVAQKSGSIYTGIEALKDALIKIFPAIRKISKIDFFLLQTAADTELSSEVVTRLRFEVDGEKPWTTSSSHVDIFTAAMKAAGLGFQWYIHECNKTT